MLALRQIAALSLKEWKILWRDRQALALLFLMPTFFILVMSVALQGVFEAGSRDRPLDILVVNQDRGELAQRTVAALRSLPGLHLQEQEAGAPVRLERAEALLRSGAGRFALVFGPEYSEALRGAGPPGPALSLLVDPAVNGQVQAIVRGSLEGVVDRVRLGVRLPTAVRELLEEDPEAAFGGGAPPADDPRLAEIAALIADPAQRLSLDVRSPAGFRPERRPTSTEQNVPAYAIFGVFFIVLTIAKSFLRERADGTLVRLQIAPLGRATLIAGKLLPFYVVNLIQVALMFAVGWLCFGLDIGDPRAFLLVALATAGAACGLGVLVAAVSRSEAQADTLAVLLAITLSAMGGLMVPAYVMPSSLQSLSQLTPQAWALAGFQDVIARGLGVADVWPEAAVLLGFAAGFGLLGLWRLRLN